MTRSLGRTLPLAALLAACTGGAPQGQAATPGVERAPSPAAAAPADPDGIAAADGGAPSPPLRPAPAPARPPVKPVGFDQLVLFLPPPPPGFRMGQPQGGLEIHAEGTVNEVQARYTLEPGGDEAPTIDLTVIDGAFVPGAYTSFEAMAGRLDEQPGRSYVRRAALGSEPGYESWNHDGPTTQLAALVADRYLVSLTGTRIPPEELRAFAAAVRVADLATLDPVPAPPGAGRGGR